MREYIVYVYAMKYDSFFESVERDWMSAPIIERTYTDKQAAMDDYELTKDCPRELYHTAKACGHKPEGYMAELVCIQDEDIPGFLDNEILCYDEYTTADYEREQNEND